jgi:predicted  nucleic acid-binding Zn-ribbon protein
VQSTTSQFSSLQQEKEAEIQESKKMKDELLNAQTSSTELSTQVTTLEQELEVCEF